MKPQPSAWSLGTLALTLALAAPVAALAQPHRSGGDSPHAAVAVPRSAPAISPARAPAPAPNPGRYSARSQERTAPRASEQRGQATAGNDGSSTGPGRRRGDLPKTGDAVARKSPPPPHDGGHGSGAVIVGAAPWLAYGGYYGAYYDDDPWLGWDAADDPPVSNDEGAVRLKVKPAEASVFVDGYYVGIVDNFDGVFQRLRLEPGPHHVEIRAPEYDTLSFDVLIQPDHTTTYEGEMTRVP